MNSLKKFDISHFSKKIKFVAGTDEAGRGPLAGPVVAAAVIFDKDTFHKEINDSKKLSEKKRNELYDWIIQNSLTCGIEIIGAKEIDALNILQASLKAMKNAVSRLSPRPNLVLIDGNKSFITEIKTKTVIGGDSRSFAIAAASIIAKVTRDKLMKNLAQEFPEYGWEKNKGYPTLEHRRAIKKFGPTPFHRTTFIGNIITKESNNDFSLGMKSGRAKEQTR